jgi:hypothetical protein
MKYVTVNKHPKALGTADGDTYRNRWGAYAPEFALVDENNKQLHVLTTCRSYLVDCIWGKQREDMGKDGDLDISNMVYHYKEIPYDTKNTRVLISMEKKEIPFFDKNIYYIHRKEKKAGLQLSEVFKVKGRPNCRLVVGDPAWMTVQWKLALYTFYLKLMTHENRKGLKDDYGDGRYYRDLVKKGVEIKFLKNLNNPYFITPATSGENHCHVGFVAIMDNNAIGRLGEEILGG